MGAELDTLFKLQEIDDRLLEKKREIAKYEAQLAERKAAIAACDKRIEELGVRRKQLVNDRAFAERRVTENQDQLRDRRQRLGRVRTEKELRANENEINSMREEISQHEEELLALMDQVDAVEAEVAAAKAERQEITDADHRHVEEEAERIAALQTAIDEIKKEREAVVGELDGAIVKRYDMVLERRGGRAVVQITSGSCGGCHMGIPPQTVIEILRAGAIRVCPNCQRILHVPQESA